MQLILSHCDQHKKLNITAVLYSIFLLIFLFSSSLDAAAPVIDGSAGMQRSAMEQRQLADRLNKVERMVQGQGLGEVLNRLDTLQREVQKLTGDVEVLSHELRSMKKRQRELYLDTDRRLTKFENGGANQNQRTSVAPTVAPTIATAARAPTSTPRTLSATRPTQVAPVSRRTSPMANSRGQMQTNTINPTRTSRNPGSVSGQRRPTVKRGTKLERDAYERAFNLLKKGRYSMASASFQAFLDAYPRARYASNAQYWLGEANYVQRKYRMAIKEFKKVIKSYPKSSKLPDALLKMGYAYNELGQKKLAIKSLETILQKYASSTAARLAKKRLITIKSR